MKKHTVAVVLGLVCLILTFAICIQIKTVNEMTNEVGSYISENSELKDEYLTWLSRYNNIYNELQNTEEKLEKIRNDSAKGNESDIIMEDEIKKNNRLLGLTEVKGKGVRIIIDDNREVSSSDLVNLSNYIIHEMDILVIVNELFNAGADAVAINGHRVVSTTPIVCDGNIVRVNNIKTGVPVTIEAIGYPESFFALSRPGGYLDWMKNDGVPVSIEKIETDIIIPKFDGVYNYDYIVRGDN